MLKPVPSRTRLSASNTAVAQPRPIHCRESSTSSEETVISSSFIVKYAMLTASLPFSERLIPVFSSPYKILRPFVVSIINNRTWLERQEKTKIDDQSGSQDTEKNRNFQNILIDDPSAAHFPSYFIYFFTFSKQVHLKIIRIDLPDLLLLSVHIMNTFCGRYMFCLRLFSFPLFRVSNILGN